VEVREVKVLKAGVKVYFEIILFIKREEVLKVF